MISILFTNRAKEDLKRIEIFNTALYGKQTSNKIIKSIFNRISILESSESNFTEIGSIDTSFPHLKRTYRKLIEEQYKITYRVSKDSIIYIVRIFDMRQNPIKNK